MENLLRSPNLKAIVIGMSTTTIKNNLQRITQIKEEHIIAILLHMLYSICIIIIIIIIISNLRSQPIQNKIDL